MGGNEQRGHRCDVVEIVALAASWHKVRRLKLGEDSLGQGEPRKHTQASESGDVRQQQI